LKKEKEDMSLIAFLREETGFKLVRERKGCKSFDWIKEIENVWKLIKESNSGMDKCKISETKYIKSLRNRNDIFDGSRRTGE
jgi:hypothetical protein